MRRKKLRKLLHEYSGSIKVDPYGALIKFVEDYNNSVENTMGENGTKLRVEPYYDNYADVKEKLNLKPVVLSLCRNQTPIQYIQYLVSMFASAEINKSSLDYFNSDKKVDKRWVYSFETSDTENEIIVKVSSIEPESNEYAYIF